MSDPGIPLLRVVRGDATAEETAALVAALAVARAAARRGAAARQVADPRRGHGDRGTRSGWSDRSRLLRAPLRRGPGAWRASAFPR